MRNYISIMNDCRSYEHKENNRSFLKKVNSKPRKQNKNKSK